LLDVTRVCKPRENGQYKANINGTCGQQLMANWKSGECCAACRRAKRFE